MDITKCTGILNNGVCLIKDKCHRYTSKDSGFLQSWFVDSPGVLDLNSKQFSCEMFWGDKNESIMNQLEYIVK